MTDAKKIIIEIKESGGGGLGSDNSGSNKGKKSMDKDSKGIIKALKVAFHPLNSLENITVGQHQSAKYIADNLIDLVKRSIMFTLNRTYSLTEDYISQNSLNNFMNSMSKISGVGASIIAGASAGSAFGPIGTTIGMVAGLGISIASEDIAGRQTLQGYYSSLNAATYQTEFAMQRAGLINEGRGTEN